MVALAKLFGNPNVLERKEVGSSIVSDEEPLCLGPAMNATWEYMELNRMLMRYRHLRERQRRGVSGL